MPNVFDLRLSFDDRAGVQVEKDKGVRTSPDPFV